MSRTRIVKGKITEIVGGDYNIYSADSIVDNAIGEINEKGVEKGVSYGNPEKPSEGEIKAKCVVQFRPHNRYDGEFGLDWLRAGDTGVKGDTWFGNILGKYFESDNVTLFQDTNSWSGNFKKDLKMYDKKLKSYKCITINWKSISKKPYLYPIPTLTLLKGKTAILNLKLEIKNKPKKLTLEFKDKDAEKYLTLNTKEIENVKLGKYETYNYLKITCKESYKKDQMLYVKADGEICGALHIHPNDATFCKNLNIVIIKVRTKISNQEIKGIPMSGSLNFFRNCLNQALITPKIIVETDFLDCTESFFKNQFCTNGPLNGGGSGYSVTKSVGLRTYLEGKCSSQFGNKYQGYIKLFFIGEEADWNGFSYGNSDFGVYFKTHNRGTVAHETFHALNLPHTFASINEGTLLAKYTYQTGQTNNIMDYSHQSGFGSIDRKVTYLWQWNILNSKIRR